MKYFVTALIFIVFSLLHQPIRSQGDVTPETNSYVSFNLAYLKSYAPAFKQFVVSPSRFTTNEWVITGFTGAVFTTIYLNDKALFQKFNGSSSFANENKMKWTGVFGNGIVALPSFALMYGFGSMKSLQRPKEAALLGFQAFVLSAGTAFIMKQISHRPRPDQLYVSNQWDGPFKSFEYDAFPSGHAMRAFAVATVLAGYYNDIPLLGAGLYGLAALTSYGRLASSSHWPSDVLTGAAIGYLIGRGILYYYRHPQKGLRISPTATGIGAVMAF